MKKRFTIVIVLLVFGIAAFFYTRSMLYTTYLDVPRELDRVEEYEREPETITSGAFDCDVVKKIRDRERVVGNDLEWCNAVEGYYRR